MALGPVWTGAENLAATEIRSPDCALKAFYKNCDSFVIAQREFRRELGIHRNPALPSAHAIETGVRNFKATGSTIKKKDGNVKTVPTPENIAVVREAIEGKPHRSARRHSLSLGLSEASIRRILHKRSSFLPLQNSSYSYTT